MKLVFVLNVKRHWSEFVFVSHLCITRKLSWDRLSLYFPVASAFLRVDWNGKKSNAKNAFQHAAQ